MTEIIINFEKNSNIAVIRDLTTNQIEELHLTSSKETRGSNIHFSINTFDLASHRLLQIDTIGKN